MESVCKKCGEKLQRAINSDPMTLKCQKCGNLDIVLDVDAKLTCPFCKNEGKGDKYVFKNKEFNTICGCAFSRVIGQSGVWIVRVLGRAGRGNR